MAMVPFNEHPMSPIGNVKSCKLTRRVIHESSYRTVLRWRWARTTFSSSITFAVAGLAINLASQAS